MSYVTPIGWTTEDETEYQAYLVALQAKVDALGPNDDPELRGMLTVLKDPSYGRADYAHFKRNGQL